MSLHGGCAPIAGSNGHWNRKTNPRVSTRWRRALWKNRTVQPSGALIQTCGSVLPIEHCSYRIGARLAAELAFLVASFVAAAAQQRATAEQFCDPVDKHAYLGRQVPVVQIDDRDRHRR